MPDDPDIKADLGEAIRHVFHDHDLMCNSFIMCGSALGGDGKRQIIFAMSDDSDPIADIGLMSIMESYRHDFMGEMKGKR